jgi:hypothetical protein
MANFRDLPVEITTEILKQAWEASLSTEFKFPSADLLIVAGLKPSYKPILVERYAIPNPNGGTLFAFKAACVCSLWRDIVSTWGDAWDLVVFDVQDDPTPLLDVFTWSGNRIISVYVFNSKIEMNPGVKELENEVFRVMKIYKFLLPHINRCQSIRFDVTFPTSLPPPIYFFVSGSTTLGTLNLETFVPGKPVEIPRYTTASLFGPFPKLARLSLTGFAIMEMGWDFPGWIKALEDGPRLHNLQISNFTFSTENSDDHMDEPGQDTVRFFVSMLSRINPIRLHLVGISHSSDSTPRIIPRSYNLSNVSIHFQTSSGPFLADFLSWTHGGIHKSLRITGCETIPPHFDTPLCGETLTIHHMADSSSLRAILANFWGATLVLDSCAGFDNTLIKWLSQPDGIQDAEGATFAAKAMNHIRVKNCTNFTSDALRRLVAVRHRAAYRGNEAAAPSTNVENIDFLNVTGTAPVLKPKDQAWFVMNPNVAEVCWYREEADGLTTHMFDNIED